MNLLKNDYIFTYLWYKKKVLTVSKDICMVN